jgi:hypothetical protein
MCVCSSSSSSSINCRSALNPLQHGLVLNLIAEKLVSPVEKGARILAKCTECSRYNLVLSLSVDITWSNTAEETGRCVNMRSSF